MKHPPMPDVRVTRVPAPKGVCSTELQVIREVSEYQGDREIIGQTLLDAAALGRQAYVWTLTDGEHLLLLMQGQRFRFWIPSREPVEQLRERAIDWLTEPAAETSSQQVRGSVR